MYHASNARHIFIAIPAPDRLQDHARRVRGQWMDAQVRWIAGRDLHVTLVPPWESRGVGHDIDRFKAMTITTAPFVLPFERIGFGPSEKNPWLIWAEGATTEPLQQLKREIETVFQKEKDKRPFHLHVTLARFEANVLSGLKRKKIEGQISWRATANTIALMESIRVGDGVEYRTVVERVLPPVATQ